MAYQNDGHSSTCSELVFKNPKNTANAITTANVPKIICGYGTEYVNKLWENSTGVRVRKLSPREYFRLMDVSDTDVEKIQTAGISCTQQYKMAGNSIVVSVLYHIFRTLFMGETADNGTQLKLF